jgi:mannose/fructose/N-acetylgalactosamine-specific phosphotransferase system component IIC
MSVEGAKDLIVMGFIFGLILGAMGYHLIAGAIRALSEGLLEEEDE